jgi:hypothetical protein
MPLLPLPFIKAEQLVYLHSFFMTAYIKRYLSMFTSMQTCLHT